MRALKWTVSIIVILGFVLGVALPFSIGIWIQKIYPSVFLGSVNASSVQMTLLEYHRGIYSSTAKVALNFNSANTSSRVVFLENIQHGPLVFENGPVLALALINAKSDDPKFQANSRTIWKLNRRIISTLHIPTLDVSSTPIHFSLQNLNMQINYHSVEQKLKADATIDKMELQGSAPSAFTVNLNQITSTQDLSKENNIWYGSRSGTIAEIIISNPQGSIAQIHNLSATGSITAVADKTNVQMNYQAKNSTILNNAVDSVDFAFSINNLDTKSLSDLIEKMEAKKESSSTTNINAVSEGGLELISKGILIQLDRFSIMTKQGEARADGKLSLPPLGSGNVFQLLAALKIDFNTQVPKDLLIPLLTEHYQNDKTIPATSTPAEYAQQQVDTWIQQKILIPASNGLLIMKVQFENSKLLVNGAPLQPAAPAPAATPATPETTAPAAPATPDTTTPAAPTTTAPAPANSTTSAVQ